MGNLELIIIKLILKKENLNKYYNTLIKLELNTETKTLINLINKYYNKYTDHIYIAPQELITYYNSQYPSSKEQDKITQLITNAADLEVSDSLAADTIRRLLAREWASNTIGFLVPISEGRAEPEEIYQLPARLDDFTELLKEQDETQSPFLRYHPDELFGFDSETDGLHWPVRKLNEVLGPVIPASLGHVFARVETGKTTFTLNCLTQWGRQLRERQSEKIALGIFNEENGKQVFGRAYQSLLEIPKEELEAKKRAGLGDELLDDYLGAGGSNVELIHDTTMSLEKMTELFERYPIAVCVVDIADHLHYRGDHRENEERRLNHIYRVLRELADKYQVAILSCGQAGESAAGKKRLFLENMFHSKTAKPGALDYAIGIGESFDDAEKEFRWLSVCKNKLRATGHVQIPTRIDVVHGRYYDLG